MDDRITKAMTYGGIIITAFGAWMLGQSFQYATDFESRYMISIAPALITAMGYALSGFGVLLGNTGILKKMGALVIIVFCIVIIVIRILGYYTLLQNHSV